MRMRGQGLFTVFIVLAAVAAVTLGVVYVIFASPGVKDTQQPSTTSDIPLVGLTSDYSEIVLKCTDEYSGCKTLYYRLDSDPSEETSYPVHWRSCSDVSGSRVYCKLVFSGEGNWGVQYYGVDQSGNDEKPREEFVLLGVPESSPTPFASPSP
ncbi:MAG: hypothetical protein V1834_01310, partial [Candidatus Micrarchaeota archaeon]